MTEFEIRSADTDDVVLRSPIAEFRGFLIRAGLLFGVVAVALALVVAPQNRMSSGADYASIPELDMMTTGSIRSSGEGGSRVYHVQRSILQSGSSPCIVFPNGNRRGAC